MTNSAQANQHDSDTLDMHSPNLVDDNVQKIMALFPNCITESEDENGNLKKAVDFDLLRQELSQSLVEGGQERYRLDWPGKRQAILEANSPIAKTLRPAREESVNFDTTENLFIEGDNLEALKLLQESYLGQVKMIYIDPPYNTGNDFIYEDDFAEDTTSFLERSEQVDEEGNRLVANTESNGRFHSDWLTMMYSRLKLARNLLKDDGVIFISIDDNEVFNLIKICDEIFGYNNRLENFHIQVRYTNKSLNEDSDFQQVMEYILVYAKNNNIFVPKKPSEPYSLSKFIYSIEELSEGEEIYIGRKKVTIFKENEWSITKNAEGSIGLLKETWASGSLVNQSGSASEFLAKYLIDRKNIDGLNVLYKIDNMGEDGIGYRYVTGPKKEDAIRGKFYSGVPLTRLEELKAGVSEKFKPIVNYYDFSADFGNIRHEGGVPFNSGKKPIKLLSMLIDIANLSSEDIIMDFFSGSGSTAHAVLQYNVDNLEKIKTISIQLDEKLSFNDPKQKSSHKFCTDNGLEQNISEISKERIRRAGQKILTDNKDKNGIENLDIGFRVLKIDSTNMKDVYYTPDEYLQADLSNLESHIKEDRTGEDLLFQVLLDWGVPLSLPIESKQIQGSSVYYVGIDSLVACFDTLTTDLIDEISKDKPLKFVSSELAIAHDQDKTNIKARFAQLSPDTQVKFI